MTFSSGSAALPGLEPWDLLDPEQLLVELARLVPLTPGRVLLALVDEPATHQRLRGATVLWLGTGPDDEDSVDAALVAAMRRLGVGDGTWPEARWRTSALVVVVVRHGRAFARRTDWLPTRGWMYCTGLRRPLLGDTILVTEHGWTVLGAQIHGLSPRAAG